ncbi:MULTISPECIES: ABC transporter permease [unclassified Ruegeria]|uniref:ABC transporter permease n=1 Tax=unclassified Ruegeria TaxID=2625375 RepID=UPI001488FE1B|nr:MULTISPECIES: ABC transporter permease [unclassified Ruegeria]NOD33665.1 ABC transporter permease subunit [Ruegeria sp. HKCCD7296]NOD46036.1 ABC transporter permease subunit [Ruegeria sp. HKCCD5849]NOD50664.1 ABC transporter permease subunit [Ruegeria sp. HKCCD5851]NOD67480.1 ABC transporter permease subunit [Ruegeria sp. HKCCD7303]NOE33066.1 ABC transporter permease subunit [Ruegeria sp. HKCCD7318]
MEPLTWTGSIAFLNPILLLALAALALSIIVWIVASIFLPEQQITVNSDGSVSSSGGLRGLIQTALHYSFLASVGLSVAYLLLGIFMGTNAGIIGAMSQQFLPVWVALIIMFASSIAFKRRLGLYGKLYDSPIGMIGFGLVMFWVFTGIFGAMDMIVTHDPLTQLSGMKNKVPGTPLPNLEDGQYAWYLLGGDNLARDVFSRMVKGAWIVVQIAPLATMFAFMVGITLGLPAGYYGGRLDTFLSFLANLILAFPVILLFYLLVTPEIVATGVPNYMAAVLFVFPILFLAVLLNSRFYTRPKFRTPLLVAVLGITVWLYLSLISTGGYVINTDDYRIWGLPTYLDLFDIPGGILVVFVSVVFVNSPTVFRIVRGLALDIKTRDYVAAAQTRGEGPWYIMLWEILPNARGPLIVDFCLRIGYTTILLGTLGFFGLGLPPESPDWGSTINEGRKLLSIYLHPALPPAFALLSLVLGLNLLADGLREESLKD